MTLASMSFHKSTQRGYSLIELMVAMALGLIILLAVSELFINNSRTRNEIEKTSRQIENGRYAIQLLTDELSNAGYFGETGGQIFPVTLPPACAATLSEVTDSTGVPVFGDNDVAAVSAPDCLSEFKDGGSYLAVRRASTCAVGSTDCDDFEVGKYHLQVSACQTDEPGGITFGTEAAAMSKMDRLCDSTQLAPIYRYLNRIYYVNSDYQLVRAELKEAGAAEPYEQVQLVDGIERLHFEYGVDDDNDGVPETYDSAPTTANWEDLVTVRAWVLARNQEKTTGYTDTNTYQLGDLEVSGEDLEAGFKRQLYSTTVRLNNVAGRREE